MCKRRVVVLFLFSPYVGFCMLFFSHTAHGPHFFLPNVSLDSQNLFPWLCYVDIFSDHFDMGEFLKYGYTEVRFSLVCVTCRWGEDLF